MNVSCSVLSDSLWPHGLEPAKLLCPWDSPGKNTGVASHSLLQGILPTQRLTSVSHVAGRFFAIWASREAPWWRHYFQWQWSHTWNTQSHVFHVLASVFESNSFPLWVNDRCFPPFFYFIIFALQNIVGVVMNGCESWTIKKAESWKIDGFELWCWKNSWESLGLQGDPTSPS